MEPFFDWLDTAKLSIIVSLLVAIASIIGNAWNSNRERKNRDEIAAAAQSHERQLDRERRSEDRSLETYIELRRLLRVASDRLTRFWILDDRDSPVDEDGELIESIARAEVLAGKDVRVLVDLWMRLYRPLRPLVPLVRKDVKFEPPFDRLSELLVQLDVVESAISVAMNAHLRAEDVEPFNFDRANEVIESFRGWQIEAITHDVREKLADRESRRSAPAPQAVEVPSVDLAPDRSSAPNEQYLSRSCPGRRTD